MLRTLATHADALPIHTAFSEAVDARPAGADPLGKDIMPPDAEDASSSSSAEHSGDQDIGEMAEHLEARADSDDSPKPSTDNGQKPPSSAKDPSRPRRKKARRACFACQRAHLTCGKLTNYYDLCSLLIYPPSSSMTIPRPTDRFLQATSARVRDASSAVFRTPVKMAFARRRNISTTLPTER